LHCLASRFGAVFDEGCSITEKTLVTIGDDCTLGAGSVLQFGYATRKASVGISAVGRCGQICADARSSRPCLGWSSDVAPAASGERCGLPTSVQVILPH
jgi:hypothetical protein